MIEFSYPTGPRQAPRWLDLAAEGGGKRVAGLLPRQPPPEHSRNLIEPGQDDRRAGVDHYDRPWIRGHHAPNQLVLASRELQVCPIPPFRLDLLVGAHHDDGHVGAGRRRNRLGELLVSGGSCGSVPEMYSHEAAEGARINHLQGRFDSNCAWFGELEVGRIAARLAVRGIKHDLVPNRGRRNRDQLTVDRDLVRADRPNLDLVWPSRQADIDPQPYAFDSEIIDAEPDPGGVAFYVGADHGPGRVDVLDQESWLPAGSPQ